MSTRPKDVDTYRPRLTQEEVTALVVGSQVREIQGQLCHVAGIIAGMHGIGRVCVLAYWSTRFICWRYKTATPDELLALYTPEAMP